ncbi:hypothetical protein CI105_03275 [Candidatus Izimaplasma bacterium ZiA1]|uniref:NAD(P)/FAD-dependent oxidoreductase n=1 Tax=Candidatus Izimoplasma sp. ZiA1 TaxID=2024899 RepID=UPI000BAA6938|nr:hypothetical protein CI105_03275 [Candidatus Izimaplasma bacterium ZiA1]
MIYDVIIIGGGPSGLISANEFQKESINYLLLEKNESVGKKLLITGGKRCNVTNNLDVKDFIDALTLKHKRFLYKSLNLFGPKEVISYFDDLGLSLQLENDFKYFPSTNKSSSVLEALLKNLDPKKIKVNEDVKKVSFEEGIYVVKTSNEKFMSKRLIIATGSMSYPMTGSNGDGIKLTKSFNLQSDKFTPAETSVYSSYVTKELSDLQGVSILDTTLKINNTKHKTTGAIGFTHFGLSGPAVFHLSENIYLELQNNNNLISFNLTSKNETELNQMFLRSQNIYILKVLERLTIKRIAKKILDLLKLPNKKVVELSKKDINKIIKMLISFEVKVDKVETVEKAFVNRGGIKTSELNPNSFEVKKQPGLFIVGETVDLHGPIGGFNITIALSSGYSAAFTIISEIKNL